jgi:tetratricopeptide (TPR) repeat protein
MTSSASSPRWPKVFGIVCAIILAVPVAFVTANYGVQASRANYAITRAVIAGWDLDAYEREYPQSTEDLNVAFADVVAQYRIALEYELPGKYEYRHRFAQYMLEYAGRHSIKGQVGDALKYAIEQTTKNINENPGDYLPELYASRLYILLGKEDPASPYNDEALKHSAKALEYSPTFIRTYYEVAQAYLNKRDYDAALSYFERAAVLNPDVGVSYWYWGMTEIQIAQDTHDNQRLRHGLMLVRKAIDIDYGPSEQELLRIVGAGLQIKDYDALIMAYQMLTKLNKTNTDYYESLAVVYGESGRIDEAIAAARQAVLIDSRMLPKAKDFVRSLGREL